LERGLDKVSGEISRNMQEIRNLSLAEEEKDGGKRGILFLSRFYKGRNRGKGVWGVLVMDGGGCLFLGGSRMTEEDGGESAIA